MQCKIVDDKLSQAWGWPKIDRTLKRNIDMQIENVEITKAGSIMFSELNITKLMVVAYYHKIAKIILPYFGPRQGTPTNYFFVICGGSLPGPVADGEWLQRFQNLLITGFTGCGKTYLACAVNDQLTPPIN